jgi:hypothetical protein
MVGKLARGGTGLGLLLHTENAGHTQEEENALLAQKRSQGFVPYNGANAPGASGIPSNVSSGATSSSNPSSAGSASSTGKSSSSSGTPYDFNAYAQKLGKRESGGNYGITNSIGFVGKYQFGAAALEDLGLVKPGTGKKGNKALNDPANWNTPGGLQGFLNDAGAQEDAFKRYTDMHYRQLLKAGVITAQSTPGEVAGYLATAHLKGIGGAIDLKKGKVGTDAYGTSTSSYFSLGSGSQGGGATSPIASAQPFSTPSGTAVPGPNMQTTAVGGGGGGVAASTAATSVGSNATAAADPSVDELRKQTSLLASIAQNTASNGSISVNPKGYKQDAALVAGGIPG